MDKPVDKSDQRLKLTVLDMIPEGESVMVFTKKRTKSAKIRPKIGQKLYIMLKNPSKWLYNHTI